MYSHAKLKMLPRCTDHFGVCTMETSQTILAYLLRVFGPLQACSTVLLSGLGDGSPLSKPNQRLGLKRPLLKINLSIDFFNSQHSCMCALKSLAVLGYVDNMGHVLEQRNKRSTISSPWNNLLLILQSHQTVQAFVFPDQLPCHTKPHERPWRHVFCPSETDRKRM